MHRAYQMTAKASRVGFDWSHLEDFLSKMREEASEEAKKGEADH